MTDDCVARSEGGVGIIELARPNKLNCISEGVLRTVLYAVQKFEADPTVKALLICGRGKNFCAGADLAEVKALRSSPAALRQFLELGNHTLDFIESLGKPVVAAVQGFCLAGGFELALACDVVFAAESARFGDQHAEFGLYPGWGGARRMAQVLGPKRSFDLMASARRIDANEAAAWGLVSRVVPDEQLSEVATEYCRELTKKSSAGLREMKRATLRAMYQSGDKNEGSDIEAGVKIILSDDASEGIAAFEEKRPPLFGVKSRGR